MIGLSQREDCYLIEVGHAWLNANPSDQKRKGFKRNMFIPNGLSNKLSESFNNTGIFTTVMNYDGPDQDHAMKYGKFYLDLDSKDYTLVRGDALRAIAYLKTVFSLDPDTDIEIYYSGQKGLHIMIAPEALGVQPHAELNGIYKTLAHKIAKYAPNGTVDLQIYDTKRMFRHPGSIHEVTGCHKISLKYDELRKLSQDEIKVLAEKPRVFTYTAPTTKPTAVKAYMGIIEDYKKEQVQKYMPGNVDDTIGVLRATPPCIAYMLENGASDGNRNNSAAALTSFFKRKGFEYEAVLESVTNWNADKNTPALHDKEVENTVKSIYTSDKVYGCTALAQLSHCDKAKCTLKRGRS